MTGSFYLTESVLLPAGLASNTRVQATVDLGAYVNVPTGQAIAIESVDFIHQDSVSFSGSVGTMLSANGAITSQLVDLNPGTALVQADSHSLVASSALNIDLANNIASHSSDMYPDNFGPTSLSEAFLVVNDTLYLVAGPNGGNIGATDVYVTARVRCRVVKLSSKDWMSIAIQSTATE
tara:strand:- start:1152 stop:1688 length:537 start_codon:yes stop_codon:yes gene_type:complete